MTAIGDFWHLLASDYSDYYLSQDTRMALLTLCRCFDSEL